MRSEDEAHEAEEETGFEEAPQAEGEEEAMIPEEGPPPKKRTSNDHPSGSEPPWRWAKHWRFLRELDDLLNSGV